MYSVHMEKAQLQTFKEDAKHETLEGEQERLREKEMLKIVIIFCGHCSVVTMNIMYMCRTVSSWCSTSLSLLKLRSYSGHSWCIIQ